MLNYIIRGWQQMSTLRKLRRVAMIGLALFGLWALTPYLYNRQVDEAFPAAAQPAPARAEVVAEPAAAPALVEVMAEPTAAAMAEPTKEPVFAEPTASIASTPAPTAAPATAEATAAPSAVPATTGPVALASGSFVSGPIPGDVAVGTATIYRLEDGKRVLRLDNFTTTNGPDLFVVLSGSANPAAEGVKAGAFLQLAALKGNQGNQNYELPADFDLSQYGSVVIWCRAFNVVFGQAALQ